MTAIFPYDENKDKELVRTEHQFPTNFKMREVECPRCKLRVKTNLAGPICVKCNQNMITLLR